MMDLLMNNLTFFISTGQAVLCGPLLANNQAPAITGRGLTNI